MRIVGYILWGRARISRIEDRNGERIVNGTPRGSVNERTNDNLFLSALIEANTKAKNILNDSISEGLGRDLGKIKINK